MLRNKARCFHSLPLTVGCLPGTCPGPASNLCPSVFICGFSSPQLNGSGVVGQASSLSAGVPDDKPTHRQPKPSDNDAVPGVLRPVAAFPAWATCRPSRAAFSGAWDDLMLTLRNSVRSVQSGALGIHRRQVACVKGGDRSPHSRASLRKLRFIRRLATRESATTEWIACRAAR